MFVLVEQRNGIDISGTPLEERKPLFCDVIWNFLVVRPETEFITIDIITTSSCSGTFPAEGDCVST